MSENIITWPTIDELPRDELGLIIIPKGYPDWYDAEQLNRKTIGTQMSNKADMAAPAKHILQLVEGTHPSQTVAYFKTQEGVVTVGGEVSFYPVDLKAYSEYTFGVLPAGFRPAYELTRGLVIRTTESFKFVSGKLSIDTEGVIKGYTPNTVDGNYHNFIFEASFLVQ